MKIAIVSDTHENWKLAAEAIQQEGGADYLFFLGDYASDGEQLAKWLSIPSYIVRGNCDYDSKAPLECIVELGGWRFLLCHGHMYHVKEGLNWLRCRAEEEKVDFALFGHTHQAVYEEIGDLTMINPGNVSAFEVRFDIASWGLLTLSDEKKEKILKKYEKKACQNK